MMVVVAEIVLLMMLINLMMNTADHVQLRNDGGDVVKRRAEL